MKTVGKPASEPAVEPGEPDGRPADAGRKESTDTANGFFSFDESFAVVNAAIFFRDRYVVILYADLDAFFALKHQVTKKAREESALRNFLRRHHFLLAILNNGNCHDVILKSRIDDSNFSASKLSVLVTQRL